MMRSSSHLNTVSLRHFRLRFSYLRYAVRRTVNGLWCSPLLRRVSTQCRSLCRLPLSLFLPLWVLGFAVMLWLAATSIAADNLSYRGVVHIADELFPWHRTIQKRAEYGS